MEGKVPNATVGLRAEARGHVIAITGRPPYTNSVIEDYRQAHIDAEYISAALEVYDAYWKEQENGNVG